MSAFSCLLSRRMGVRVLSASTMKISFMSGEYRKRMRCFAKRKSTSYSIWSMTMTLSADTRRSISSRKSLSSCSCGRRRICCYYSQPIYKHNNRAVLSRRYFIDILMFIQGGDAENISATVYGFPSHNRCNASISLMPLRRQVSMYVRLRA